MLLPSSLRQGGSKMTPRNSSFIQKTIRNLFQVAFFWCRAYGISFLSMGGGAGLQNSGVKMDSRPTCKKGLGDSWSKITVDMCKSMQSKKNIYIYLIYRWEGLLLILLLLSDHDLHLMPTPFGHAKPVRNSSTKNQVLPPQRIGRTHPNPGHPNLFKYWSTRSLSHALLIEMLFPTPPPSPAQLRKVQHRQRQDDLFSRLGPCQLKLQSILLPQRLRPKQGRRELGEWLSGEWAS